MTFNTILEHSHLGKTVVYDHPYDANLLFAVPRQEKRALLGIHDTLPFQGVDLWHAYEISWLDSKGKPHVAIGQFWVPCTSRNIIESKSFKLYLNSFNQTRFESIDAVLSAMQQDLSAVAEEPLTINLFSLANFAQQKQAEMAGQCLDDLAVEVTHYHPTKEYLKTNDGFVKENYYSHLFKSNCPITGQPDWASVVIRFEGKPIEPEGLLRYLISYRQNQEFHEDCAERIFMDIMQYCEPEKLTVYMRYTRRGGLDINPFRSNFETMQDLGRNLR